MCAENSFNLVNLSFFLFQTALHWGAKHGNDDVIKLIAGKYSANVNAKTVRRKFIITFNLLLPPWILKFKFCVSFLVSRSWTTWVNPMVKDDLQCTCEATQLCWIMMDDLAYMVDWVQKWCTKNLRGVEGGMEIFREKIYITKISPLPSWLGSSYHSKNMVKRGGKKKRTLSTYYDNGPLARRVEATRFCMYNLYPV